MFKAEADINVQRYCAVAYLEMSDSIKNQLIRRVSESPFIAIQLDESTDICNMAQVLVFVRYLWQHNIKEDFLFCQPRFSATTAEDIMRLVNDFFDETHISWKSVFGICTDGARTMLGTRSGFVTRAKEKIHKYWVPTASFMGKLWHLKHYLMLSVPL